MKTKDCELLGAFVPQHISAYFNLLAENKKTTKSALLNTLIKDWYLENREIWDYADLLKEKQHSIQLEWKVIKQNKEHISFDAFLERQYVLLVKKIGIKDTELIIKSIVE
jgi:hypothetical protein